jgi:hypothetical protein
MNSPPGDVRREGCAWSRTKPQPALRAGAVLQRRASTSPHEHYLALHRETAATHLRRSSSRMLKAGAAIPATVEFSRTCAPPLRSRAFRSLDMAPVRTVSLSARPSHTCSTSSCLDKLPGLAQHVRQDVEDLRGGLDESASPSQFEGRLIEDEITELEDHMEKLAHRPTSDIDLCLPARRYAAGVIPVQR